MPITEFLQTTVAYSIIFSSSRIFPGQLWETKISRALALIPVIFFFNSVALRLIYQSARIGISCRRSRRGGTSIGLTFNLKKRSLRNFPESTSFCNTRLVAAMMRTSTASVSEPPTLSICFSSIARKSLACTKPLSQDTFKAV